MSFNLLKSNYFGEYLGFHAENIPDKIALTDINGQITYRELYNKSRRVAGLLNHAGISKGERIIIALGNTIEQMYFHYGAILGGYISVPLSSGLSKTRLQSYIDDSGAACIVKKEAIYDRSHKIIAELDILESSEYICSPRKLDDVATIMYTTGSTGNQKGVMLSHNNLIAALDHIISYIGYSGNERELVILPISHSFALGHVYSNNIMGGYVHLENGMNKMKRVFNAFYKYQITGMPSTPSMVNLFTERYLEAFKGVADKLNYMVVNTAPLPPESTVKLLSVIPKLRLMIYYGLTEASRSTFITLSDEDIVNYKSVGKASKGVKLKIIDGEVCISGKHLFNGYWNKEYETKSTLINGWMHTGDLGFIDSSGYLTITGRLKEQINIDGLKVTPQEVESALLKCKLVKDIAVVGVIDPLNNKHEVVAALIVSNNNKTDEAEFARKVRAHGGEVLEPYMVPEIIKITERIPRSESGKVLRKEVEKLLC